MLYKSACNSEVSWHGYCNHVMMCNVNDCSIHVVNSEGCRHAYCNHVMIYNVNDCSIHAVNSEGCRHGYCNHVNVNVTFWQVTIILSMMFLYLPKSTIFASMFVYGKLCLLGTLFVCTAIQVANFIRLTPNFTVTLVWSPNRGV